MCVIKSTSGDFKGRNSVYDFTYNTYIFELHKKKKKKNILQKVFVGVCQRLASIKILPTGHNLTIVWPWH